MSGIAKMTTTPDGLVNLVRQLPEVGGIALDRAFMISVRLKTIKAHEEAIRDLNAEIGREMSELRKFVYETWDSAEINDAEERVEAMMRNRAGGGA